MMYSYCKTFPNSARRLMKKLVKKEVGDDFDMKHFSPTYNPWDERLCAVPDGDLFEVLKVIIPTMAVGVFCIIKFKSIQNSLSCFFHRIMFI